MRFNSSSTDSALESTVNSNVILGASNGLVKIRKLTELMFLSL